MKFTGGIGVVGVYVPQDPAPQDPLYKQGEIQTAEPFDRARSSMSRHLKAVSNRSWEIAFVEVAHAQRDVAKTWLHGWISCLSARINCDRTSGIRYDGSAHVAAAFVHLFYYRDRIMSRILPGQPWPIVCRHGDRLSATPSPRLHPVHR